MDKVSLIWWRIFAPLVRWWQRPQSASQRQARAKNYPPPF